MNIDWGKLDWIAVYGAIVATLALILSIILAIREIGKDKRKVIVSCAAGFFSNAFTNPIPTFTISAVNNGHRPVEIREAGLEMNTKNKRVLILDMLLKSPFPQHIADGQSVSIYQQIEPLILDIEKEREEKKNYNIFVTRAYVRDAGDNYYYCPPPQLFRDRGIVKQRAWPLRQWQKLMRKK